MSHFTVMVIGNNIEEQLQPFHEFECTGHVDQYVVDVDKTAEVQARINDGESIEEALSYWGLDEKFVEDEACVERDGAHKFGFAVVKNGELVRAVDRTNPNKKWDWYTIGGRWTGFFSLRAGASGTMGQPSVFRRPPKIGNRADQALKGHIDFGGMRNEAAIEAAQRWQKVHDLARGPWVSWAETRERFPDLDAARTFYNGQPQIQAMRSELHVFMDEDEYLQSKEVYTQRARNGAVSTYAVLHDGKWIARGEMGWFGCSDDKVSEDEWQQKFAEFLDSLPDDTLLTVVDCHI